MIGIIGAMEEEISRLVSMMAAVQTKKIAGCRFYSGKIEGKNVVVAMSGIGKVNMAVCAQTMIDTFHPQYLINTGVAGSLNNDIHIGDVVIGTDSVEHDMDTSATGDAKGQVPRMNVFAFPCDPELAELAISVNAKVNPTIKTFTGRVATGDQFIVNADVKKAIIDEFGAICCEMEGASMAHTAYLNHISCLIIRSISDQADGSAQMDYQDFKSIAVEHETNLVLGMIKKM